MKLNFVSPSNPILTQQAEPVVVNDISKLEFKKLIDGMLDIAYEHRADRTKPTVVGLAAPQVGISKRIILVDVGADGKGGLSKMRAYINPEITWHSDEQEEWCEGCWSTSKVCGAVSRPAKIRLSAIRPDGHKVHEEHIGYIARIFQHEIDHLAGKEFVSHINNPDKLHWVEKEQWTAYKNEEGWRDWPHKCPFNKWQSIKTGNAV